LLTLNSDGTYTSDLLAGHPWLIHGFGTRLSPGNWPGEYTQLKQVHSDCVIPADGRTGRIGVGDALTSRTPGFLIGVRTADCVPVLLADPTTHAVAAVHAGWKGTALAIVRRAVERMAAEYGSDPTHLVAAIGPAIGKCCYEVGPEVCAALRPFFPEPTSLQHVDLTEANRRQLVAAGLSAENIDTAGLCTKCGSQFHSFRRDRDAAGRQVAAIGIRTEPRA
jgi:YfiH family protein